MSQLAKRIAPFVKCKPQERRFAGRLGSLDRQQGTTLIEVLITALILGTAILAVMGMQGSALKFSSSAYLRSQANMIAYDLMDRIRFRSSSIGPLSLPTSDEIDLLVADLPSGSANLDCVARECALTLSWLEPMESPEQLGDGLTSVSYSSRL